VCKIVHRRWWRWSYFPGELGRKARLVRGRYFQPSDVPGSQPVVVVNETFARVWLERDPIGQKVAFRWGITGTQTGRRRRF
jgi:hypothetical protein